jgi:hypothetical protein
MLHHVASRLCQKWPDFLCQCQCCRYVSLHTCCSTNSSLDLVNPLTEPGSVCTFTCNPGFVLSGAALLICQSNGKWNSQAPICKSLDGSGSQFDLSSNGNGDPYSSNSASVGGGSLTNNVLSGAGSGGGLNWPTMTSSNSASGSDVRCRRPNKPRSGSVTCECPVNPPRVGCSCTYSCSDGYQLVGYPTVYCRSNGEWTGRTPNCRRKSLLTLNFFSDLLMFHFTLVQTV